MRSEFDGTVGAAAKLCGRCPMGTCTVSRRPVLYHRDGLAGQLYRRSCVGERAEWRAARHRARRRRLHRRIDFPHAVTLTLVDIHRFMVSNVFNDAFTVFYGDVTLFIAWP